MNKMDLNKLVVRAGGLIDVVATLKACETALAGANTEAQEAFAAVGPAVDAVFAKHSAASINMPAIASFAVQEMGTPASKYNETVELVTNYVRANAGEGGKFLIKKGKGGGVSLRAATPAPAAE
jgi:hypothetical protein